MSNPFLDGEGIELDHLQREMQRRRNAAAAAGQKAQNDQIIGLLIEQKVGQEREKKRLDALPKCPACLKPVEVGSRRCANCQSAIISWDNRSFRLICLKEEAGTHLQARIDELSRQVVQWAGEALREANDYVALIKSQIATDFKVIAATLNKTRPDDVFAVATVLECYLSGKPLLDPKQSVEHQDAILLVDSAQKELELASAAPTYNKPNLKSVCGGFLIVIGGFALLSSLNMLVSMFTRSEGWEGPGLLTTFLDFFLSLFWGCVFVPVGGALCRKGYDIFVRSAQRVKAAGEARDAALTVKDDQVANASVKWCSRLEKAGITPYLDSLKKSLKSAHKSAAIVNDFLASIIAATTEIVETTQFAASVGVDVKESLARVRGELGRISAQELSPQALIDSCTRGQVTGLQTECDDTVRLAKSLQLFGKPSA